jgi:hypothetical protein
MESQKALPSVIRWDPDIRNALLRTGPKHRVGHIGTCCCAVPALYVPIIIKRDIVAPCTHAPVTVSMEREKYPSIEAKEHVLRDRTTSYSSPPRQWQETTFIHGGPINYCVVSQQFKTLPDNDRMNSRQGRTSDVSAPR